MIIICLINIYVQSKRGQRINERKRAILCITIIILRTNDLSYWSLKNWSSLQSIISYIVWSNVDLGLRRHVALLGQSIATINLICLCMFLCGVTLFAAIIFTVFRPSFPTSCVTFSPNSWGTIWIARSTSQSARHKREWWGQLLSYKCDISQIFKRSTPLNVMISRHPQINTNWSRSQMHWYENRKHYNDVIMGAIVSPITNLKIVYSTVYSDADKKKHQSSASLAFMRGIHRWPVNSPHKWPVTRKMFSFDDVIMSFISYWSELSALMNVKQYLSIYMYISISVRYIYSRLCMTHAFYWYNSKQFVCIFNESQRKS